MIGTVIVFILHNLLLFYLWPKTNNRSIIINKKRYDILFLVFFLLSLLGLQTGDYLHSVEHIQEVYNDLKGMNSIGESLRDYHMEPIYNYLAVWLKGSNLLWRSIVYGLSFIIIFFFIKRLDLNYWSFFYLFTLICFSGFIVGRMYWGVALFFCSMAYARKTGKWYYYLISLLSVFAHKCLYICPLFIPLAFIRINKKTLPLVLLLFVFMVFILKYVFGSIILLDAYMDGFSNSIEHYTESDIEGTVFGRSVGEKVIYFAEFLGTIILIINIIYISVKNNPPIPAYIQSLMSLGVFFLLLAFAFIIGNFDNGTLGWRYLTISWFPLVLVCSYFKENRYIKKEIWSLAVGILLFAFEASLTVPIYYAYIG